MTTRELQRAVATAIGETCATIRNRGFHLAQEELTDFEDRETSLAAIDCPCCGGTVVLAWNEEEALPGPAECRRRDTAFEFADAEVYATSLDQIHLSPARTYQTNAA